MSKKAVFLDRDGVINAVTVVNGVPHPPQSVSEIVIPNDAFEALMLLKKHCYKLIVVTNQPDVARGKTKKETVEAINQYLKQQLPIDAFYICYHDNSDNCACRKPKPGLITMAAERHDVHISESYMIGDRWKDMECAKNANCTSIFLDAFYEETINHPIAADHIVTSLRQAVDFILNK